MPRMYLRNFRFSIASVVLTLACAGLALSGQPHGSMDQPVAHPLAHFHHLHLNATDPPAAITFYTSKLESEKRKFSGVMAGPCSHNSWLLFTKVDAEPTSEITSGIWHMGWGGGENMKETYQKQVSSGTKFQTPITDISDQCDGKG